MIQQHDSQISWQVLKRIEAYADVGATQINLRLRGLPIDERVEQIERFVDEVMSAL